MVVAFAQIYPFVSSSFLLLLSFFLYFFYIFFSYFPSFISHFFIFYSSCLHLLALSDRLATRLCPPLTMILFPYPMYPQARGSWFGYHCLSIN